MAASNEIQTQGIDQRKLRPLIERVRERIKNHEIVQGMFDEYKVDLSEIDLIPMAFADLDVSARTDHGVIYFGTKLLKDGDFDGDDHYLVHELTHFLQQTTGTKPTQGSEDGKYLDNPDEIEGFQNQTQYLSETRDEEEAEKYVEKVLDHHDMNGQKREVRKEELMALTRHLRVSELLKFAKSEFELASEILNEVQPALREAIYKIRAETRKRTGVRTTGRRGPKKSLRHGQEIMDPYTVELPAVGPVPIHFVVDLRSDRPKSKVEVTKDGIMFQVRFPVTVGHQLSGPILRRILDEVMERKPELAEALARAGSEDWEHAQDVKLANSWYQELTEGLKQFKDVSGLPEGRSARQRWQQQQAKRYQTQKQRLQQLQELTESGAIGEEAQRLRELREQQKKYLFEELKGQRPPRGRKVSEQERAEWRAEMDKKKSEVAQNIKELLEKIKLKERQEKAESPQLMQYRVERVPRGVGRPAKLTTQMFDRLPARIEFIDQFVNDKINTEDNADAIEIFVRRVENTYEELAMGEGFDHLIREMKAEERGLPTEQAAFRARLTTLFETNQQVIAENLARSARVGMSRQFVLDEIADDLGLTSADLRGEYFAQRDVYYQMVTEFIAQHPELGSLPAEEAKPEPKPAPEPVITMQPPVPETRDPEYGTAEYWAKVFKEQGVQEPVEDIGEYPAEYLQWLQQQGR